MNERGFRCRDRGEGQGIDVATNKLGRSKVVSDYAEERRVDKAYGVHSPENLPGRRWRWRWWRWRVGGTDQAAPGLWPGSAIDAETMTALKVLDGGGGGGSEVAIDAESGTMRVELAL